MLESVTLAEVVELVVEVLVDLAGGAVLDEQAAQDAETTHPHHLAITSENVSIHIHLHTNTPPVPPPQPHLPLTCA